MPEQIEHIALVDEARRWVAECGEGYRAETMEALFEGNEVAMHWASKVLAAQDMIEALVAHVDAQARQLSLNHNRRRKYVQARLVWRGHMRDLKARLDAH